jgi:iron complex outermembrane receptor protein
LGWQSDSDASKLTDYFVQNASFLKCDNITLGYSFEKAFGLAVNGRVYGTCSNVFTITNYDGIDPEVQSGIDGGIYPRPISFIVGLSLNF